MYCKNRIVRSSIFRFNSDVIWLFWIFAPNIVFVNFDCNTKKVIWFFNYCLPEIKCRPLSIIFQRHVESFYHPVRNKSHGMFCLERCDCNFSSNRFAHQSIRNIQTNHRVLEHYILDQNLVFEAHLVDNPKFAAIPHMGLASQFFLWVWKWIKSHY